MADERISTHIQSGPACQLSHGTPLFAVYVAGAPPKECNLNFSSSTIVLLLVAVFQNGVLY